MIKCILWELKCMILFFEKDINIYFFNNENIGYRKSYTPCYTSKTALIGNHNSVKDDQFYLSNV